MHSVIQNASPTPRRFLRRALTFGAAALGLSVFLGIAMLFWREYGSSLSRMPRHVALDLTIQATAGPIYLGAVLFIFTVPVIVLLAAIFYAGIRRRSLALAVLPFALLGAYWLWLVKLIGEGAFD